jgi:hypothetical protein
MPTETFKILLNTLLANACAEHVLASTLEGEDALAAGARRDDAIHRFYDAIHAEGLVALEGSPGPCRRVVLFNLRDWERLVVELEPSSLGPGTVVPLPENPATKPGKV